MQAAHAVAGNEALGRDSDKSINGSVGFQARDLGANRQIPQLDRTVIGARDRPPIRQHAKGRDPAGIPIQARDLGPGRDVPYADRVIIRARG